jgi:hypothetical protein
MSRNDDLNLFRSGKFRIPGLPSAGAKCDFQVNGLYDGTYAMGVELAESSLLCTRCVWVGQSVTAKVAAGAAVSGVSVVAPKGVIALHVREADVVLRIGTIFNRRNILAASLRLGVQQQAKSTDSIIEATRTDI